MSSFQQQSAEHSRRAVSPVIGVILMVAITVILAAVIGAFVLEIGDQQETAPNTSFDSEQRQVTYKDDTAINNHGGDCLGGGSPPSSHCYNGSTVDISHAGGTVLDVTSVDVVFEGNASVWGTESPGGQNGANHLVAPQPDLRPAMGSNDPVTFASGESWNVLTGAGASQPAGAWTQNVEVSDEHLQNKQYRARFFPDDPLVRVRELNPDTTRTVLFGHYVESGDQINVVWTASSGGKTQTLFEYTVQ